MSIGMLKDRITNKLKEAQFPSIGSTAMRKFVTRFVYIGRNMVPSWLITSRFKQLREDASLLDTVLSELTCPVCDIYMVRPIQQCVNGHSICEECFDSVDKCPTCRSPKSYRSRSVALEYIADEVSLPCRYREQGCKNKCLGKKLREHEEDCEYSLDRCLFYYCRWRGCRENLTAHMSEKHEFNYYENEQVTFTASKIMDRASYKESNFTVIIHAYGEFFLLAWGLDFTGVTNWAMFLISSPKNSKDYSYKIMFHCSDPIPDKSAVMIHRQLMDSSRTKEYPSFSKFRANFKVLNRYCSGDGVLKFTVTIMNKTHPEYSKKFVTTVEVFKCL